MFEELVDVEIMVDQRKTPSHPIDYSVGSGPHIFTSLAPRSRKCSGINPTPGEQTLHGVFS